MNVGEIGGAGAGARIWRRFRNREPRGASAVPIAARGSAPKSALILIQTAVGGAALERHRAGEIG